MKRNLRVRPAAQGGSCVVRHPEHGEMVVPHPSELYAEDDPLVRAYPWLFVADDDLPAGPPVPPEYVRIEDATRSPGRLRGGRRV